MQEEYKGYTIKYQEFDSKFVATIGESDYTNSSLEKVRKRIDEIEKQDFNRVPVIYQSGWGKSKFVFLTITSEFQEGKNIYAWTINSEKSRSKHDIASLMEDTVENREKIVAIEEIETKIAIMNSEISNIKASMTKYKSQLKVIQDPPQTEEASKETTK